MAAASLGTWPPRRRPLPAEGWSAWINRGGKVLGNPAVAWTADGTLSVFARGLDSYIWVRRLRGGTWEDWTELRLPSLSGPDIACPSASEKNPQDFEFRAEPGVVSLGDRIDLVGFGADSACDGESGLALYHSVSFDAGHSWSAFEDLGGAVFGPVAPVWRDWATFDVLGRGGDGAVWRNTYAYGSGWTSWTSLGGCVRSGVAAASRADGEVHLAVVGCNDSIWHGYYVGNGAINWEQVGQSNEVTGTPGIVLDNLSRRVNIFARARSGHSVMQTAWNGGWSAWHRLGGCAKAGVAAAARPLGYATAAASIDVLATGCNSRGLVSLADPAADAAWHMVTSSR